MESCWIDPKGKIIDTYGYGGHNGYASEILEKEMGLEELYQYMENNNISYPYQVLHRRGWIRVQFLSTGKIDIMGDCIDLIKPMRNTMDPPMNSVQMRVAKLLCDENNTSFHQAINDKRFW